MVGDLEVEVQAGGGGQDTPVVQGGGLKRSQYAVTKRTTDESGRPGGATCKEDGG